MTLTGASKEQAGSEALLRQEISDLQQVRTGVSILAQS